MPTRTIQSQSRLVFTEAAKVAEGVSSGGSERGRMKAYVLDRGVDIVL